MSEITPLDTYCIIHIIHPTEFDVTDTWRNSRQH